MNWSLKRKLLYGTTVCIIILSFALFVLRDTLFPSPTCFDTKKNGYETGIDCGGTCSLRCTNQVTPLSVVWTKAVQDTSTTYDVVGMVSNRNIDNASHFISYTFTAYDKLGTVLATLTGKTIAPIDGDFPIIVQGVKMASKPDAVSLDLVDGPHYSVLEKPTSPTLKVLNRRFEDGTVPRVYATIQNTKQKTLSDVPIRVLLFDVDDNLYASGETVVPFFEREGSHDIVITWNNPLPHPPTRIGVYPIFDPFLGGQ
jgi:hypothetical protein